MEKTKTKKQKRTDSRCMMDEESLESFMTEVPIIQKPVHFTGLVSIRQEPPQ